MKFNYRIIDKCWKCKTNEELDVIDDLVCDNPGYFVYCRKCGHIGPKEKSNKLAVKKWNNESRNMIDLYFEEPALIINHSE